MDCFVFIHNCSNKVIKVLDYSLELEKAYSWMGEGCELLSLWEVYDLITIEFNKRFTSRMGDANGRKMLIRLSAPLWTVASEKQKRETVIHELCHIVDYYIHERSSHHGEPWKILMRQCGLEPQRCHVVDTAKFKKKRMRYRYACSCGKGVTTKVAYNRIKRGVVYRCRTCKEEITLTGEKYIVV